MSPHDIACSPTIATKTGKRSNENDNVNGNLPETTK